MQRWDAVASNDSKGCGGVMRVAPIGMYYAALAGEAHQAKPQLIEDAFTLGCKSATITHGHPTGQLVSGVFAAVIMQLLLGVDLRSAIDAVMPLLTAQTAHEETTCAIQVALHLAQDNPNEPETLEQLGGGWVAEEALAIALYCALSVKNFRSGVVLAVNHSGDSDSTGSMAGQLLGAIYGVKDIPQLWLSPLELRVVIESMADDLSTVSEWRLDGIEAEEESNFYFYRYPGASFPTDRTEQDAESLEVNQQKLDDLVEAMVKDLQLESSEHIGDHEAKYAAFDAWNDSFRKEADRDGLKILSTHLDRLGRPDEPDLLLDGTVRFVQLMAGYSTPKNQFLENQKYDSVKATGAPYQVTFCSLGNAYARLNLPASLQPGDLADLYDDGIGYSEFLISRADGAALNPDELAAFEKVIWNDFLHDYGEGELEIFFDYDGDAGILKVTVQPVDEDENEDFADDDEDIEDDDTEQGPVHGGKPHD